MNKISILSIIIALFPSCKKGILQQSNPEDQIVVQAYLYNGEPVDDI